MPAEDTVDYLGFALTTTGTPLVDRPVTLKRSDTLATLATTVTDATGRWRFDDISPAQIVRAEISAGTTPQTAVKSVFSGDAYSLYIREKLTAAPAAIFNLPPLANIYSNGTPLATTLDGRYVNIAGDSMTGPLTVSGVLGAQGGLVVVSGLDVQTGDSLFTNGTFSGNLTVGGTLTLPLGEVGEPSLTYAGDPDTGISHGAANVLGVHAGGIAVAEINPFGLTVFTPLLLSGGLEVDEGATTLGGTLAVTGATTLGNLVAGQSYITGGLTVHDGLNVASGGTTVAGTLLIQNQIRVGATAMSAATSVANVVRKIQIHDAAGAAAGWVPVYGAAG